MLDLCVCDAENKLYENEMLNENDKVKFIISNCCVTEKVKDGYYTYFAVDLNSLKKKQLLKRKYQITFDGYEQLAQKIKGLEFYQDDTNLEQTRYDRAVKLLCHIFSYILPAEGFKFRENQRDLSLEIFHSLQDKSVALMEAEVGTGKTHAYIIAVIIYNMFNNITNTTIISTSTIALQKAITEEYIPQLSEILLKYKIIRKPLTFAVRKGKSHYMCDLRLKTYYSSLKENGEPKASHLMKMLKRLFCSNDAHVDLDTYPLTKYVKDKICVTNKCSENCSKYEICRYISFAQKCMYINYDFQIANHNYVFADLLSYKPLIPKYNVIIFDEAHKLYDVAKQMYGCYILFSDFDELKKIISESKITPLLPYCSIVDDLWKKILWRTLCKITDIQPLDRIKAIMDEISVYNIDKLSETLKELITTIYDCGFERQHIRKRTIRKICEHLIEKLHTFHSPEHLICWIECVNSGSYNLCAIPKNLSNMVCKNFWQRDVLSVLTSGTLSAAGDFGLIEKKLGIDLISSSLVSCTSKKSLFDYKNNALIYIPEHIPFPDVKNIEYSNAVIAEIVRLLKVTNGHSLILFTSYILMEVVFNEVCKNSFEYPLFIMGKGRIDVLKAFKISGNGVLFASDAAGEGVDIVGDTLSNLIIVKLPFAVPDPISDYEQSVMGGLNVYLNKINTPNMIIKLKQYAGRLIRSEGDTGVVAILDSRVNSEGKYRKVVLDSLFNAPVTNKITDVEQFIIDKKDDAYFA